MAHPISRIIIAAWLAGAALVFADEQKCNGSARECDQQIRQFLSGRRFLGATIRERSPGLVVETVNPGGPAQRADLQPGDRLIACNSKPLTQATPREFKQILADARETGRVRFIVWRRGAYKRIEARLEPYTKEQIDKIISAHLSQSHPAAAGAHR
jgi:predicted metalloprotease with PDZ domain